MSEPKCQEALLYSPPLTTACLNIPSLDTYLQYICQIKVNAFMFYLQIPLQFSIKQSLGAVFRRREAGTSRAHTQQSRGRDRDKVETFGLQ